MLLCGKFVDFLPGENICHLSLRLKFGNQDQKAGRGSLLVSNRPTAQHSNIEGDNRARMSQKSKYLSCDPKRNRDRDSYSEQCRGPSFGPHGPPHKQNDPIFLHLGDLVDHFNFVIHHLCKNQIVVISGLLLNDGL